VNRTRQRHAHRHRTMRWRSWAVVGLLLACMAGPATAQTVQLAKRTIGGAGNFDFSMVNLLPGTDSITTTVPGTPVNSTLIAPVTNPLLAVTITEQPSAQHTLTSASCEDTNTGTTGIGTLVGNTLTIDPIELQSAPTLLCTFENTLVNPDLTIVKAVDLASVPSGGSLIYTLTASNVGVVGVTDAVLRDTPDSGLSCTSAASCTPAGNAVCPASLPANELFGTGVTVPSLPAGSSIVVTATCTVTASGQ
jgi:uncharacterized repeat protein (TIGR01451 family)